MFPSILLIALHTQRNVLATVACLLFTYLLKHVIHTYTYPITTTGNRWKRTDKLQAHSKTAGADYKGGFRAGRAGRSSSGVAGSGTHVGLGGDSQQADTGSRWTFWRRSGAGAATRPQQPRRRGIHLACLHAQQLPLRTPRGPPARPRLQGLPDPRPRGSWSVITCTWPGSGSPPLLSLASGVGDGWMSPIAKWHMWLLYGYLECVPFPIRIWK